MQLSDELDTLLLLGPLSALMTKLHITLAVKEQHLSVQL